jgi:hypothetical protein
MNLLALVAVAALAAGPAPQQGGTARGIEIALPPDTTATETAEVPTVDLRAAVKIAAREIALQQRDPETGQFVSADAAAEDQTGYFGMMYGNSYNPAQLSYFGASVADIWSRNELQKTCDDNPAVECSDGWPSNVSTEVLMTGLVYMGATGIQRLAKKYWDVDLDDGWKNMLIYAGLAGVRLAMTWDQVSNANAVREFGR